ncbi:hypothetical protein [Rhizobium sp. 12,4]|uniref:hypothetical protein n=1 Tax=Rhizobium sp. 12,4 TaxID=3405135 RepID=UPI003D32687C
MSVFKGPLKSSANAGQLSADLAGKVGIKQYYNGAKRMLGFEPIPQAGFGLLPGSAHVGTVPSATCRKGVLKVSASLSYTLVFTAGKVDIWRNDRVKVASVILAAITADILPELGFYGEANTFGVFHQSLPKGIRLLRDKTNDTIWTSGDWPFADIPNVDLGGTYTKTTDTWIIYWRWTSTVPDFIVTCTIDGDTTVSCSGPANPNTASGAEWATFATNLRNVIDDLPGFSTGVTVTDTGGGSYVRTFRVEFGGPLQGKEFDFSAQVVSTSEGSALATHNIIGRVVGEPLISTTQGGFAGMELFQDRAVYFAPKAKTAAVAMSQVGEYFNLNIEVEQDNGARLEAMRSETAEVIRHALDNTYLLLFTDQAEWFASSRTVKRNEPLNWVRASEIGSRANCRPVVLEGDVYFISGDGGKLYSIAYDAVSTTYVPKTENDLNKDLISSVKRLAVQRKIATTTSNRLWLLRDDGRLVCAVINKTQEMMAACEWPVAGGGLIKDIAVDGQEQVWITVDRAGTVTEEILEEASVNLLQSTLTVTTDLTGQATGLSRFNGMQVWAEINGDVYGPYLVSAGAVVTDVPSASARIGLWVAPIYETMPYVRVLPDDSVVRRPGAVKAAKLYLLDATSIAIGANGRAAKPVSLNRADEDVTLPPQGYTGHREVLGLIGATMDPTLVITQARPGRIRVRDFIPGVKL